MTEALRTAWRARWRLAWLVAIGVAAVAVAGCGKDDAPEAVAPEAKKSAEHKDEVKLTANAVKKYGITVEPVKKQVLVPTFTAPGRVAYNTEAMAHVGAVISGRIVDLKVRKGDVVKKGDELLVIESPELGEAQSELLQKRTAVEIAGPAVELSKSAYDRAKSLYDAERGIALTEVQKRESEYKAAVGALQSARSSLTAAQNKLHLLGMNEAAVETLAKSGEIKPRFSVMAPISGTVISRDVTLGELVSREKESLLVIANMTTLWVIADVPQDRLPEVAVGAKARVRVRATAPPIDGTVSLIDSSLDPNTRSAQVRVEVKDGMSGIRPGMFAQVEIAATSVNGAREAVVAVPDEAVQTVDGAPAVFVPVRGEENTFARRQITIGDPTSGYVPVLSGLKEGEPVVSRASFILKADLGKGATEE